VLDLSLDLPRDLGAGQLARQALRDQLDERLGVEQVERLELAVTELVNNAVLHGRGAIGVRVQLDADVVRAEVTDEGSGFEHRARRAGPEQVGGQGLAIVDAVASRWGIHEGTTHVWVELDVATPGIGGDAGGPELGERHRPDELGG
jgi:anti-sigma regulatory factor (Ser/Thr protein kinase)